MVCFPKLPDGRWVTSKVLIDDWVLGLWQQQQPPDVALDKKGGRTASPETRCSYD